MLLRKMVSGIPGCTCFWLGSPIGKMILLSKPLPMNSREDLIGPHARLWIGHCVGGRDYDWLSPVTGSPCGEGGWHGGEQPQQNHTKRGKFFPKGKERLLSGGG